jgi:RTX calcium-binding nonapeptide repeat (4 copies)
MSVRWLPALVAATVALALMWPAAGSADHIVTSATVDARLKERRSTDFWVVEISWTAACNGASPGTVWFDGDLYLVDLDTRERIHAGGVVSTSGERLISGKRDWFVSSRARAARLMPELTIHCYENFPLHGGREVVVTGTSVVVPQRFAGSGGGGGGGGGGGSGDPTAPLARGGCVAALVGTNGPDTLRGGGTGEVILGFGGRDRIEAGGGHDCLLGDDGNDVLRGQLGNDRLTGGAGADVLVGGPGINAYDAGSGADFVDARNAKTELVRCGSGRDRARVDRRDRVQGCERVSRPA